MDSHRQLQNCSPRVDWRSAYDIERMGSLLAIGTMIMIWGAGGYVFKGESMIAGGLLVLTLCSILAARHRYGCDYSIAWGVKFVPSKSEEEELLVKWLVILGFTVVPLRAYRKDFISCESTWVVKGDVLRYKISGTPMKVLWEDELLLRMICHQIGFVLISLLCFALAGFLDAY